MLADLVPGERPSSRLQMLHIFSVSLHYVRTCGLFHILLGHYFHHGASFFMIPFKPNYFPTILLPNSIALETRALSIRIWEGGNSITVNEKKFFACMSTQRTLNSQNNFEKEEKNLEVLHSMISIYGKLW